MLRAMETLLAEIEAFLVTHDMAPTRFGHEALGDRHLVFQLRRGRRLWPDTADKVRKFMVTYRPKAEAA